MEQLDTTSVSLVRGWPWMTRSGSHGFTKNRTADSAAHPAAFFERVRAQAEHVACFRRALHVDAPYRPWASLKSFSARTRADGPTSGESDVNFPRDAAATRRHPPRPTRSAPVPQGRAGSQALLQARADENRHAWRSTAASLPPMATASARRARHVAVAMPGGHPGGGQRLRQSRLRRSPALAPGNPHVAQNTSNRSSASIDAPRATLATRESTEAQADRRVFGWLKTIGLMRQTRFPRRRRVGWMFVFSLRLQPGAHQNLRSGPA